MNYLKLLERVEAILGKAESKQRLEIPKARCEIRGRSSWFLNFEEIAKILRRDPNHLAKYLFKELGTRGHREGKSLVFKGRIDEGKLRTKVDDYIKEYVQCKQCKSLDTKFARVGRILILKCEACGASQSIPS